MAERRPAGGQQEEPAAKRRLTEPLAAPAATPSPRSTSSWQDPPADILRNVFVLIPLRPRLVVMSLVCRRWLMIARSTAAALMHLPGQVHQSALTYLSNVTALSALPTRTVDLSSVRHLDGRFIQSGHLSMYPAVSLASINSLTSLVLGNAFAEAARHILLANKNTLTHLELEILFDHSIVPIASTACSLPWLQSLSIGNSEYQSQQYPPEALHIVEAHSSQLTSLSFMSNKEGNGILSALSALDFPKLRHCCISVAPTVESDALMTAFRARAPQLTSLGLWIRKGVSLSLLQMCGSLLVHLQLDTMLYFNLIDAPWDLLTNLTSLDIPVSDAIAAQTLPNLRTLSVANWVAGTRSLHSSLTSLTVCSEVDPAQILVILLRVRLDCPLLRELYFHTSVAYAKKSWFSKLGRDLTLLEGRGLTLVVLRLREISEPLIAIARKLRWLSLHFKLWN